MNTHHISRRGFATAIAATALGGASVLAAVPAQAAAPRSQATSALDLEPFLTVSGAKATGFAGVVALHLRNAGRDRYWGEFPAVTFTVEVHTEDGPQGVDRLITAGGFNGAYVRDLGFDAEESVRTFSVTLSNPVPAGEEQLVASLRFGDGHTKEGRLINRIVITQTGRLSGDESTGNDQSVDSRTATVLDTGGEHTGLF